MCSYQPSAAEYITSCNKNFKIHYDKKGINDMPGKIFIKKSIPVNYSYLKVCDDKSIKIPPGYMCYKYVSKGFKNDCLQFAEGLTINNSAYKGKECILRESNTKMTFGDSDNDNMKIAHLVDAKHSEKNERVNPKIGESYAFVLKNIKKVGEAPYHIAHVLFKDGTTNITLEANAGDTKAKKPKFDMYDTLINSGATFHDQTKYVYKQSYEMNKIPIDVEEYVTVLLEKANN